MSTQISCKPEISHCRLYAEQTLAYILNKLRRHNEIIKFLHEKKNEGWRKMKYARGLFDRSVGFLSLNDVNKEFIALIEPFHCKLKTSSEALYKECSKKYKLEPVFQEELFSSCDIIIVQGEQNDCKLHISAELINKIKNEALVVLASDDVSVDTAALENALKSERINAVVNDKLSFANKLSGLPNVIVAKQYY